LGDIFCFLEKQGKTMFISFPSFFCSQDLAFVKSMVKVFFISLHAMFSFYEKQSKSIFHFFARTKKRNKEMRRLKRRRTAMPHKAANFIHECVR